MHHNARACRSFVISTLVCCITFCILAPAHIVVVDDQAENSNVNWDGPWERLNGIEEGFAWNGTLSLGMLPFITTVNFTFTGAFGVYLPYVRQSCGVCFLLTRLRFVLQAYRSRSSGSSESSNRCCPSTCRPSGHNSLSMVECQPSSCCCSRSFRPSQDRSSTILKSFRQATTPSQLRI